MSRHYAGGAAFYDPRDPDNLSEPQAVDYDPESPFVNTEPFWVVVPRGKGAEATAIPPGESRGLTERMIRQAAWDVRAKYDKHPTREDVAAALHTSVPTLRRSMLELQMRKWPPAPPED